MSVSFAFPSPDCRQRTSSLPELQLICLLTIATKLYHPFDTLPRHVTSLADPAALAINWPSWVQALDVHNASDTSDGRLQRGSEIHLIDTDVMKMSGKQLDEYMDYFERTFIDSERIEQKIPKELLDMFPTGRLDGSETDPYSYYDQSAREQDAVDQRLRTMIGSMTLRSVISEDIKEPVRRVGSFYKRYRYAEDLKGEAKAFHEKAAEAIGVKLETLLLAVGQVERMLIKWRETKVKERSEEAQLEDAPVPRLGDATDEYEDLEMGDESE